MLYVQVALKLDMETTIEREFGNLLKFRITIQNLLSPMINLTEIPTKAFNMFK